MTGIGYEIMAHPQRDLIVTIFFIITILMICIGASEKLQNFFLSLFDKIRKAIISRKK